MLGRGQKPVDENVNVRIADSTVEIYYNKASVGAWEYRLLYLAVYHKQRRTK